MKKGTVWLLVILAILVVGGAAYYLYTKNSASADSASSSGDMTRSTIVRGTVTNRNDGAYASFKVKVTEGLSNLVGKTIDVRMVKSSTTYSVISPEYSYMFYYPGDQFAKYGQELIGKELLIAGRDTLSPTGAKYMIADAIAVVNPGSGSVSAQQAAQPSGYYVQTMVTGKIVNQVSMGVFTIKVDAGLAVPKGKEMGINVVDGYTTYSQISTDGSSTSYGTLGRFDDSKTPIGASVIISGKERVVSGATGGTVDFIADAVAVEKNASATTSPTAGSSVTNTSVASKTPTATLTATVGISKTPTATATAN